MITAVGVTATADFFPDGHPGNGTGALVGYDPLAGNIMETAIAHSGQSMPAEYNNVGPPYYSETERTWATPQNWTVNGVDTLVLHVRGSPANGAGQLYVALDDSSGNSAVVNHPDAAAVTSNTWLEWKIPLSSFSKVTATKIKKMYIGVGDRNSPKAGGAGSLYIDDIRVIRSE